MRLRTVGLKLSLALTGLVAGALAIVYLAVVPTLEDRLIDGRLSQLHRTAEAIIADYRNDSPRLDFIINDFTSDQSQMRGVRVTIYHYLTDDPPFLVSVAESRPLGQSEQDPIVQRAAEARGPARGVVERAGTQYAEVAIPFDEFYVLLVAAPIGETLENVSLVRRRLLAAGVLALLAAAAVGFLLARVFARRVHRLERAANRIAGGRFDEPVEDSSDDELGELARAFDRMRSQLAVLERARREFIANASHELRTPIFALGGHVELMTEDEMDAETRREFLAEMRIQVERLGKLATDLLDLSRLDAGRLRVELASVDLVEIAESVAAEFEAVGRARGHVIDVEADGASVALGDEERVRQIARILLDNAIVHTPRGTNIRLAIRDADEGVVLAVEDDGPGIPEDDQAYVFDRFYRAGGGVTVGSGLGLAIARELATLMGGEIELESRAGSTEFALRLPKSPIAAARDREPVFSREKS